MEKDNNKTKNENEAKDEPVKNGQEAIKIHKDLFEKDKPKEQQDQEEEKDAEQWHNEG